MIINDFRIEKSRSITSFNYFNLFLLFLRSNSLILVTPFFLVKKKNTKDKIENKNLYFFQGYPDKLIIKKKKKSIN
jgi:hypothetical protein